MRELEFGKELDDFMNQEQNNQYDNEVKAKWENTKQYEEYEQKIKNKSKEEFEKINNNLMNIFRELGALKELSIESKEVQEKIGLLQEFITINYYNCTNEILKGLGQMYINDERFKKNIDQAGGAGTAEFVNNAILVYCSK